MDANVEITLLSEEDVWGVNDTGEGKLEILKKYGTKSAVTDFAIVLGAYVPNSYYNHVNYDDSLKGRTGWYYTTSSDGSMGVRTVNHDGLKSWDGAGLRTGGVRPILPLSILNNILPSLKSKNNQIFEIEYGEYPQYVVSETIESILEEAYLAGTIRKTGKTYTTDSRKYKESLPFEAIEHEEYEYNGRKYIRAYCRNVFTSMLSNGKQYEYGDNVWIEVSPLKWYVDPNAKIMLSKNLIASGLRFCNHNDYDGNFKNTEMYKFLNTYFAKDILPDEILQMTSEKNPKEYKINPYNFDLDEVSEEDILKGAIKSDIPVFLHGPSSEGKSARVKQIDPDCLIIYLRNASPESLNGKSVYNAETGEMIDVKPTWLKKLEVICEAEPNKLHIVFFDEITHPLPSIQGMAFNIVLDREVNGIWELPKNARIVAAGNEMKDSLSANQLAEPLFNRFAHVYIRTTTEGWLKWARENNIHPAIYSFIAYKKGETLRSKYDGEKPNADPRKWEMASKMLYATGNPEMLRALVGEDITKEFVKFCKQPVITLNDVLNGNYNNRDIQSLNTASRYATTMSLTQVDEENMEKVRDFIANLGAEYTALFDTIWARDNESRLELIAEVRLNLGVEKYER